MEFIKNLSLPFKVLLSLAAVVLVFIVYKVVKGVTKTANAVGSAAESAGNGVASAVKFGAQNFSIWGQAQTVAKVLAGGKKDTAAEQQKKIELARIANSPSATKSRIERAQLLVKKFQGNKGLRVIGQQNYTFNRVQQDAFGALHPVSGTLSIKKGQYIGRERLFLMSVSKQGYITALDSINKKHYSVNPWAITVG